MRVARSRVVKNIEKRTKAKNYSKIAKKYGSEIYSTRKTIVGIRDLQKYALNIGGANINRMTLDDFFFIKDNHISQSKDITKTIAQVKAFYPKKKILFKNFFNI